MSNARYEAASILHRFLEQPDQADQAARQRDDLAPLTRELVLGCYRQLLILDWIIKKLATRKPDLRTRSFLLPAIYELLFLDGTPDHAVVHETMEGAKKQLKTGQQKFLNALLRRCCREREVLLHQLAEAPPRVRRSHPPRLVEQWSRHFTQPDIDAICTWNNQRAPVCLRISPTVGSAAHYVETLAAQDIRAGMHPGYPDQFVELQQGVSIATLPGYTTGAFYVQDPSTIHAPELLQARPGERILDLCAAPGGKTILLAEAMQGKGTLLAVDRHRDRVDLLKQNLSRMSHTWVKTLARDAAGLAQPGPTQTQPFDAILLDAPCSNTGVLRRRPDARWRYSVDTIKQLNQVQGTLLDTSAKLLQPGGRLVYSTCSIEHAENEGLLAHWLERHQDFTLQQADTLLPGQRQCDGSFAALLIRE